MTVGTRLAFAVIAVGGLCLTTGVVGTTFATPSCSCMIPKKMTCDIDKHCFWTGVSVVTCSGQMKQADCKGRHDIHTKYNEPFGCTGSSGALKNCVDKTEWVVDDWGNPVEVYVKSLCAKRTVCFWSTAYGFCDSFEQECTWYLKTDENCPPNSPPCIP